MEAVKFDEKLLEFATARQREVLEAIQQWGSITAAAYSLKLSKGTVGNVYKRVKAKAAAQGYSPEHNLKHVIPAPFVARGHSTYYDRDGKPTQQWVKSRLDDQKYQEMLTAAAAAMAEELPRLTPLPAPVLDGFAAKLANLYVLTDIHLGMLAWHREGGANWDLKIAERTVTDMFMLMLDRAQSADTAIICNLGDWFHSDSLVPVTPTSGHVLDQDGRFPKMVKAGIRLMRRVVDEALRRHKRVVVLMAEGNHDLVGSLWLQGLLAAIYEEEPRVEVVESPLPYYALAHGKTALFFHHGHKKKIEQLPLLFAAQFPEIWGQTTKRYAHTGHLHHLDERERPGVKVTQHPTIAARDSHAARGGWLSERQASAVTYHSEFGKVAETIITPEMLP